jgi:hypothetical protein
MGSPLEDLRSFRTLLVEERRRVIADALEVAKSAGHGGPGRLKGAHGLELKALQEQIEAVDKAIDDEEKQNTRGK